MCAVGGANNYGQLGLGNTHTIGDNEFVVERIASPFKNPGHAIIARFDYEISSSNSLMVSFNAGLSAFIGAVSYAWNFGDTMTGMGVSPSHTFSKNGSYTVALTVTDVLMQTHSISKVIRVEGANKSPELAQGQQFSISKNASISFELKAATDPDSTAFTYSLVGAVSGGTLSNCLGGTSDVVCSYTPATDFKGEVSFSYKANDGMSDSKAVGVKINVIDPTPSVVEVASFGDHSCALFDNKKIKCWGRNDYGQLGYGNTNNIGDNEFASSQGYVAVGGNVVKVAVGGEHTCVALENNSIKCWGRNNYGQAFTGSAQIGDGESPSTISGLSLGEGIEQLALGSGFSCVLTESGRVKCWGYNAYGQLGQGHTGNVGTSDLAQVGDVPFTWLGGKAVKIAVGGLHACAVLEDKSLRCWGYGERNGLLGLGNTNTIGDNELPHPAGRVNVGQGVVDVGVGWANTCVVLEDRNVKCWGYSSYGVLGLNYNALQVIIGI